MMMLALAATASLLAPPEAPAPAAGAAPDGPVVVATDETGKATRVRIGDSEYDVCVREAQDSCINPRDAGLDFGRRELDYWPGRPASEIDAPLPAERPAEPPAEPSGQAPAAPSGEPQES